MNPEDVDHDEWEKRWRSMQVRKVAVPLKLDVGCEGFGELAEVLISETPAEYRDKLTIPNELCPICGEATTDTERVCGNLYPRFSSGFSYGTAVWIHQACFELYPTIDGPAPVPW